VRHSFCLVLLVFLAATFHALAPAQQVPAAVTEPETLSLSGLHDTITVRRDDRGVPYIEAKNDEDLYFAQGYVTASDRLWQMDLLRRNGRGELAEIFGGAAAETDKLHRRYGFGRIADAMVANATPQTRATLEAYTRGVNAYISSLDASHLPVEFKILQYKPRPWVASDCFVMLKNFAEALSTTWPLDLMRASMAKLPEGMRRDLFPVKSDLDIIVVGSDRPAKQTAFIPQGSKSSTAPKVDTSMLDEIAKLQNTIRESSERIGLYAEDLAASNNWVVSGKHTASGTPLLANDPHLDASAPSIWYLVHLSAPGLRVAGVSTPGSPGVVIGHNEDIAWAMTNLGPDVQDLYLEKFDAAKPGFYQTPDGPREAQTVHEVIKVRKSFTDPATENVPYDVTVTRHGPIVFEKGGDRYALHWTALDLNPVENDAIFALNRAKNWEDFQKALSIFPGPVQNFIFADRKGHIGYYGAGRIPIRKTGDGSIPYDGTGNDGEWTGFIPFDSLPHLFDPPGGVITTANQRISGDSYPYFLSHVWAAPYRAHRIVERLKAKSRLTAEDFRSIQADTYSYPADLFAKQYLKVMSGTGSAGNADTIDLFRGWNGNVDSNSRAALLAVLMRDAFRRRVIAGLLGADVMKEYRWGQANIFIDRALTEQRPEWLPKEFKSYAELLGFCDREARETIRKKLGDDTSKWTWGGFESFRFPHPLAVAPLIGQQFVIPPQPQNGSVSSVNVGNAVSMRFIADPGDWDKTLHAITLGESGIPGSPHWKDQLPDWLEVKPAAFPFTIEAVAKSTKVECVMQPKK
jgi:penicillin G amidase